MYCDCCGASVAAVKRVTFYQNIGLLVVRFPTSSQGEFCKNCIHHTFWSMTATSMIAGWWGVISFFTNAFYIINNICVYLSCLTMPPPGEDLETIKGAEASPTPSFGIDRMELYRHKIEALLAEGHAVAEIAGQVSDMANVPLREAIDFVDSVRVLRRL